MGYDTAATGDPTAAVGPPAGPAVGAFFDLDGTLIDGYSAAVLYRHRLRDLDVGLAEILALAGAASGSPLDEEGFEHLLTTAAAGWRGRPRADYDAWGERMAREEITAMLFHQAWRQVKAHQRQGHTVVVATSATRFQAEPLARELGVDHVLCTELEEDDEGLLTGRLAGRTGWGAGKAALVERFAAESGIDLSKSWAYANGAEDIPFLETVGRPHAVNPEPALAEVAAQRDWPVLTFARPVASSWDPRPLLRTAAVYGSFFVSSGLGLVHGLLRTDRRAGVDLATSLLGPLGGAVGAIDVEVTGEEHVWSSRPAVFLINHQSALVDLVVTARLLRSGFTAVAKREVRDTPLIGWLLAQADVAFVERDGTGGRAALDGAVERLRSGTSVVMAPEGTRSRTPSVGPFKKGAFHLAAAAGVPLVPVVIRNAGELMWRDASIAHAGTVQVHVHPPIPTDGWTSTDIDTAVEEVRALYVDTLEEWPSAAVRTLPDHR
ncbi:MAG TPA: HAD-IB family hydrolase [Actinomycetospora sp.]|jgi:putative phosphoserine phosphatase/1-acylglycerol-3-phosphate O-acyltransferase|uniref:HAD-IB family hydrolase n=1 Tax=Actinomycetospora sp. TaxID=1872135 RepID=UPI002F4006AE